MGYAAGHSTNNFNLIEKMTTTRQFREVLFSYKPMCSRLYGYEKALTFRCKHENMGTPGSCAVRKTLVQDSAEQNRQPPSKRPHGSFMEHMQALASVAQVSYWLAANAYIRKVPGDM